MLTFVFLMEIVEISFRLLDLICYFQLPGAGEDEVEEEISQAEPEAVSDTDSDSEDGLDEESNPLDRQVKIIELLLVAGADIMAVNKRSESILHYAALGGHGPTITMLLVEGADSSAVTTSGETVLHWAVRSGNVNVVANLVEFGNTHVAPQDDGNMTPLHDALRLGHSEMAQLLIKYMDMSNPPCWQGIAFVELLYLAAKGGKSDNVSQLLEKEECAPYGGQVLRNAVSCGDANAVKSLLEAGVPIACDETQHGAQGGMCETYLQEAASNGHTEVIRVLIDAGEDVNKKSKYGVTALHLAARGGFLASCGILITAGAELAVAEPDTGFVPLHYACRSSQLNVVKLLLLEGASLNVKTADGRVAQDLWSGPKEDLDGLLAELYSQLHGT